MADNERPAGYGSLAELLRLQADFQARMAEETLRYLRRLQGVFSPHAPGTVVLPDGPDPLTASAPPGGRATIHVEVENRQRVHAVLAPALTPLVSADGTTWFPECETAPVTGLVAPEETVAVTVDIAVPPQLAAATYRGLLVLRGLRPGGIPVSVRVGADPPDADVAPGADMVP